ncbi:Type II secretion system protein J precursor [Marinomonas spartinae]|uniref:Type II secretion system protein J n=1 Tax=Marinomonas spartinae TaxID=1792290 RepID=A0A1A8TVT4_9GAMM|nr:type II secretion system minor pseudopilin GspJ [Marinomonas spartinae]SBS35272.1 Type II secretion system protein J precursor [Marinomonas spartinae]SBS37933.1 Type II secretion system protein J precursor [Marinomonas spartinae]
MRSSTEDNWQADKVCRQKCCDSEASYSFLAPRRIQNRAHQAGFTLIELLITLAITAFIGLLASQLISTGFKTQVGVKDSARQLENNVRIWLTIENDMSQVIQRSVRNEKGDHEPTFLLNNNVLTFTRSGWSNPLKESRSTFQRIEYRFKAAPSSRAIKNASLDQSTQGKLIRRFWFALDRTPDSKPIDQVFSHVSEFSISVLASDGRWVTRWPPSSDLQGMSALPLAIKVTLGVNNKPAFERLFELIPLKPQSQELSPEASSSPSSEKTSDKSDHMRQSEGRNDARQ